MFDQGQQMKLVNSGLFFSFCMNITAKVFFFIYPNYIL